MSTKVKQFFQTYDVASKGKPTGSIPAHYPVMVA